MNAKNWNKNFQTNGISNKLKVIYIYTDYIGSALSWWILIEKEIYTHTHTNTIPQPHDYWYELEYNLCALFLSFDFFYAWIEKLREKYRAILLRMVFLFLNCMQGTFAKDSCNFNLRLVIFTCIVKKNRLEKRKKKNGTISNTHVKHTRSQSVLVCMDLIVCVHYENVLKFIHLLSTVLCHMDTRETQKIKRKRKRKNKYRI